LLTFQIALIVGSFLTGFLLSPLLVLSRHIAQRPARRLRYPEQKLRIRRYLALGFYVGAFLIVFGLIGLWTRWCLLNRDPWLWALFWVLEGRNKWTRPALLAYWGTVLCISVAGWNRQLARSRRYRPRNPAGENLVVPFSVPSALSSADQDGPRPPSPTSSPAAALLPAIPAGTNVTHVATDWLDAADKHVPTLRLNARRKFFHALAVLMFVPGVIIDVSTKFLSPIYELENDTI
jgi:dolichol kinase